MFHPINLQDTPHQDAAYSTPIHPTLYAKMFHTIHSHDTYYFIWQDDLHNKSVLYILSCMSGYFHKIHTLYVSMFQTVYLHDTSLEVNVLYTISSCSISQFIMSAHCRQYSCMMHSTLYVWMHHTIYMQDTAYFAHQDSPYNTPTSYILLCSSSHPFVRTASITILCKCVLIQFCNIS